MSVDIINIINISPVGINNYINISPVGSSNKNINLSPVRAREKEKIKTMR